MNSTTKDSSVEPKPVDFITRVASENGGPFTKRAYLGDDGGIEWQSYGSGLFKVFYRPEPVSDIRSLYRGLRFLLAQPTNCVIRGQPIEELDLSRPHRRLLYDRPDADHTLEEVPRYWVLFDIDDVPLPERLDPVRDLDAIAEYVFENYIPPECRGTTFIAQFSSRHGFTGQHAKMRIGIWLDRPLGTDQLKVWCDHHDLDRKIVDRAVFQAHQPIYTAAPVFEYGLSDPLAWRIKLIEGDRDAVTPPPDDVLADVKRKSPPRKAHGSTSQKTPSTRKDAPETVLPWLPGWREYLTFIGDGPGLYGFHAPLKAILWRVASQSGPGFNADAIIAELEAAIDGAHHNRDDNYIAARKNDLWPWLEWYLDRVDEQADANSPPLLARSDPAVARGQLKKGIDHFFRSSRDYRRDVLRDQERANVRANKRNQDADQDAT